MYIHVKLCIPERFIIRVSKNLKPGISKSIRWTLLSVQGSALRGGFDFLPHLTATQEHVLSLPGCRWRAGTGEHIKTEVPECIKSLSA